MTGAEERQPLADYLATCARLATSFDEVARLAAPLMPVSADAIDAIAPRDHMVVLASLKAFEQFEDMLGRTIKTIAQIMALGRIERLTPRDVVNKAEAWQAREILNATWIGIQTFLAQERLIEP